MHYEANTTSSQRFFTTFTIISLHKFTRNLCKVCRSKLINCMLLRPVKNKTIVIVISAGFDEWQDKKDSIKNFNNFTPKTDYNLHTIHCRLIQVEFINGLDLLPTGGILQYFRHFLKYHHTHIQRLINSFRQIPHAGST